MLVRLVKQDGAYVPERLLRAAEFDAALGETNNPDWKTVALDETTGEVVVPNGSIGFRWGEDGKWNLEEKDGAGGARHPAPGPEGRPRRGRPVRFPYFGSAARNGFATTDHPDVLTRNVPVRSACCCRKARRWWPASTTSSCQLRRRPGLRRRAHAGDLRRRRALFPGLGRGDHTVPREQIIAVARGFAANAEQTNGKSMVIIGAAMNHWFHMDMNYRAAINMLVMCGCVGQSGGGWSHYVGQEKLRPQTGWAPLAFATDWIRPPGSRTRPRSSTPTPTSGATRRSR